MTKNRLETICDGVFAIVITLLILDVKLPSSLNIANSQDLLNSLLHLRPKIFAFAASFFIISSFLSGHHFILSLVKKIDGVFLWVNLFYLMIITFIPFPTSILAEYNANFTALVFYTINVIFAGLFHSIMLWRIYKKDDLRAETVSKVNAKKYFKTSFLGTISGIIAIPIGLVNINLGISILILVPLYFVFDRIRNESMTLKKSKH